MLETKLRMPQPRPGTITRVRLNERLTAGAQLPLTLVSAPAGFGKSTILTEWLATLRLDGQITAWISLDARDDDPVTFWRYFSTAVGTAGEGIGSDALSLLESGASSVDAAVVSLINDLDVLADDLILVLDDYHRIESSDVHESVEFFLANAPSQIHLVLATRTDPGLPLAQLRARGQLMELRAADLRFAPDEAVEYLNGAMGLALTIEDVSALENRTEGWIAALQLAALSLQGREDTAAFIAGFAGDDRYVVDYLAEEVLQRQTAEVRQFLLQTSILDEMSGSLCDALTGQTNGKAMLVTLERRNLFLVPLDDRRQWYRYHHLFADVLRTHLLDESPDDVAKLHLAASSWYEGADEPLDSIRHAIAAPDFSRAADLIELAAPSMQRERQEVAMRDWIATLPAEVLADRPVLSNTFAGTLLSTGQFDRVESPLANAERFIDAPDGSLGDASRDPRMIVADELQFLHLPAYVAVHRAGLSLVTGEIPASVAHARRALELATSEDHLIRAAATALIGLASWSVGELVSAEVAYKECLVDMQKSQSFADTLGCSIALADIQLTLGHLARAEGTYSAAMKMAGALSGPPLRGTADMLVGLSEVHAERGDWESALDYLTQAHLLGDLNGLAQYPYRRRVALARIRESEGDLTEALSLLQQALPVFTSDLSPNVRPIPAMIARLHLKMGNIREVLAWAEEQALSVEDDLDYIREFEHITFARTLLALHANEGGDVHLASAIDFIARLLQSATDGMRTASVIEILVLQALALQANGSRDEAHAALVRAVELAEPDGYVRVFANEGDQIRALLANFTRNDAGVAFARRLVTASSASPTPLHMSRTDQELVDPLSERELDVLRLLATDLSGPAIARQMFISINTLRTHTRSIYMKLDVSSRRAAVRRAQEVGLLS